MYPDEDVLLRLCRIVVRVYPDEDVLLEMGRVTIAGSRLDVQMGFLWWHLDPQHVDAVKARRSGGGTQAREILRLASAMLDGVLSEEVVQLVSDADAVHLLRNDVVHQDWALRGYDAMRPVAEVAAVPSHELQPYLDEWERQAVESSGWLRLPAHEVELTTAQPLQDLRAVERQLAAVTSRVQGLTFTVASAREVGKPSGYRHPA